MKLVAAKCPSCGADIRMPEDKKRFFCQYCGTQILLEDSSVFCGKIQIDHTNEKKNLILRAKGLEAQRRYAEAEVYYNRVLDIDATELEALDALDRIDKIIVDPNLLIERGNNRGSGEGKTTLFINGEKVAVDLDYLAHVKLPLGTHKIEFKRAAVSGQPVYITINNRRDNYKVVFTPKMFTIKVDAKKI